MNAMARLYLVLLLTLVLPLQSLAGLLPQGDPCPMSQGSGQPGDCCDDEAMAAGDQLCAEMSQCSSAGASLLGSQPPRMDGLLAPSRLAWQALADPLSRPSLAPWRPPRA
ncbi:hypothetical protein EA796_02180 [Pseudomonas sp. AOB-7]|uniref:hypothetical protein n=1 Tax=Pseudomonas sp. AOB-7 TaxID=2482750 RepID=UPI000EFAF910|nr:hypothetical protein [Pseudomonas sp. AOB-7]RMH86661.1 hypothetical protein EA796_02180 [Pseudomonas sp. AOB-7]